MKHDPQPELEAFAAIVRRGPTGLVSAGDLSRLADHVADGVAGAVHVPTTGRLADVGSGAGFPGIVLAIVHPALEVHLIESVGWKAAFLGRAVTDLGLDERVAIHCIRAEAAAATLGRESCDVGTARAVAAPGIIAEYLSPLLRVGGEILAWTTHASGVDAPSASTTRELGLGVPELLPAPSPLRSDGVVMRIPKLAPCPDRFPRRTGVAAKRPLP